MYSMLSFYEIVTGELLGAMVVKTAFQYIGAFREMGQDFPRANVAIKLHILGDTLGALKPMIYYTPERIRALIKARK